MSHLNLESELRQLALFEMWQGAIGLAFFDLRPTRPGTEPTRMELVSTEGDIIRYESGTFGIRGLHDMPDQLETANQAMLVAAEKYGGLIYDKDNKKWTFYFTRIQRDPLIIKSLEDIKEVTDFMVWRYNLDSNVAEEFQQTLTRLINFPVYSKSPI